MPIIKNEVQSFSERIICGAPVDIYSIMIPDLHDPMAIPTAWKKFWSEFPKSDLPAGNDAYGVSIPLEDSPGMLHHIAGVEVNADYVAPEGFELVTIPAGNYLALTHEGDISTLNQSYADAYGVVFAESGNEMRPGPHLELYDSMLNPNSDDFTMGILIPIN